MLARVGHVTPHQVLGVLAGRVQTPHEGVDGAAADRPADPLRLVLRTLHSLPDRLDQVLEGAAGGPCDPHPAIVQGSSVTPQPRRHVVDHDRVLLPLVVGVREEEGEQLVPAELLQRPEERGHALRAASGVGRGGRVAPTRRSAQGHARERPGRKADQRVPGPLPSVQLPVLAVQEEQILALHVEDQGLGVVGAGAELPRSKQAVEEEDGVAGLGRHTGDAADVDVSSPGAVHEFHVGVDDFAVAREANRNLALHAVEEEGLVTGLADGLAHDRSGHRRHEDLGLEACRQHLGRFGHLGGKHPLLDQEDIAVEARALVPGAQVGHHAVDPDRVLAPREGALDHDHIVELQKAPLAHRDPEFQGRRRIRADDPAHGNRAAHARTLVRLADLDILPPAMLTTARRTASPRRDDIGRTASPLQAVRQASVSAGASSRSMASAMPRTCAIISTNCSG